MNEFCFTINGRRHCFEIPLLIDRSLIRIPPPENMPELELALTVLQLVEAVPHSELSSEFTQVANRYVQQVARALPKGVELTTAKQADYAAVG